MGNRENEKQCEWKVRTLVPHWFDAEKGGVALVKSKLEAATEMHRKLWPGVVPPKITDHNLFKGPDGQPAPQGHKSKVKSEAATVPTTLFFAYMAHMLSSPSRPIRFRQKAWELLKVLLQKACANNFTVDVLRFDLQDQPHWHQEAPANPTACQVWFEDYRKERVALSWSCSMLNDKEPWVCSTSTCPHLADFISFALDQPAQLRNKGFRELLNTKQQLEMSALTILAQLAVFTDANIAAFTQKFKSVNLPAKRIRLDSSSKWQIIASS